MSTAIIEDLLWLGLEWDGEIVYQSERLDLYAAALDAAEGRWACSIPASAPAPTSPPAPPRRTGRRGRSIPGTCRGLGRVADLSRPHAWRLDVAKAMARDRAARLDAIMASRSQARPELLGDVVLARKDAPASYHLAVTVDDAAQGVTDVVRGRDLFAATHVHRLLQALLDLPTPHLSPSCPADRRGRPAPRQAPRRADARRLCATAGADPAALVDGAARGAKCPAGYSLPQA